MLIDFPPNSTWMKVCFSNAINSGATIGDAVDSVSNVVRLMENGKSENDPEVHDAWLFGWTDVAARLRHQAQIDLKKGRNRSAGNKLIRAAVHYMIAESAADYRDLRKEHYFNQKRTVFLDGIKFARWTDKVSTVKFEGKQLPALFCPTQEHDQPAPTVIVCNDMNTSFEWAYLNGLTDTLNRRGISVLLWDHPGSGFARFKKGLGPRRDAETFIRSAADYLQCRKDVDGERIGIIGLGLGAFYAMRAAAFEKKIRMCVSWSAFYSLKQWQGAVLNKWKADPHSLAVHEQNQLDQMAAEFGLGSPWELLTVSEEFSLEDAISQVECPLLILHGSKDRNVPADHARLIETKAVNCSYSELRIFETVDGGVESGNVDNLAPALEETADFAAEWLGAEL